VYDLTEYGLTQSDIFFAAEVKHNSNLNDFIPGRVTESRRERFTVICEHGEVPAEIKGSFYKNLEEGDLFPVIGDFVLIKYNNAGSSLIGAVLPRRSMFSRADFSGHAAGYAKNIKEQVAAANFDYMFILSSLNFDFNLNRLTRYITAAWQSGSFPVIVLTKADLCDDVSAKAAEVQKTAREIPVIAISSKTGFGLKELDPFLVPQKTVIFLGSSGVGKSSLLNRLAGEDLMEVKTIREDDSKGRHTTTHRQLFRLSSGALVIDTPGMRELGLWDSREGLSVTFSDVEDFISQCRFSNCTHQTEPGCAVQAALESGDLSPEQWKNYRIQLKETAFVENHSAYLRQKQAWHKSLAQWNRAGKSKRET